jgi:hypothetical protein
MYLLPAGLPGMLHSMRVGMHRLGPWVAVWGLFTLIIGFRYRIGCDWGAYANYYNRITQLSFFDTLKITDPGYGALNWFCAQLGLEIYGVNLVCGGIAMAGLIKFIRQQPLPWLALSVAVPYLISMVFMGYTRQAVAVGFIMWGLAELRNGHTAKYIVFIVLAGLFHKTAVVMFPLALVYSTLSIKARLMLLVPLLSVVGYFLIADYYESLVKNYVEAQMQSEGGLVRVLMNAIPAMVFFLFIKKFSKHWEDSRIWMYFSIAALVSVPLVVLSSTAMDRLALYLFPLQLVFYSRFPVLFRTDLQRKAIIFSVFSGYAVVLYVWLVYSTHAPLCWVPYNNLILN